MPVTRTLNLLPTAGLYGMPACVLSQQPTCSNGLDSVPSVQLTVHSNGTNHRCDSSKRWYGPQRWEEHMGRNKKILYRFGLWQAMVVGFLTCFGPAHGHTACRHTIGHILSSFYVQSCCVYVSNAVRMWADQGVAYNCLQHYQTS